VTINNVQGTGAPQWVSLYYANGDSSWRNVTVSGGHIPFLCFLQSEARLILRYAPGLVSQQRPDGVR
jgi:hypothetical protein